MEKKNYTEVFIDGTVFTLGGTEDEAYLRQVAAYLNEKIGEVRKLEGFSRQSPEYQNLTIQLNISDDYFKEQMRADDLKQQKEELEKDAYSLKHELITTQMKYEAQSRELEVAKSAPLKDREELEAAREKLENASQEIESLKNRCESARQELAAARAELESTRAEAEAAKAECESVKETAEAESADVEAAKQNLAAKAAEAEQLRQELEKVRQELAQMHSEQDAAENELQQAHLKNATSIQELGQARSEAETAKQELAQMRAEAEEAKQKLAQAKQEAEQARQELETLKQLAEKVQSVAQTNLSEVEAAVTEETVESDELSAVHIEEEKTAIMEDTVQETASGAEQQTLIVTANEKTEAESAAAEVAAVKELVASILPKTVSTPEEQKKADEMAKQAAFKAALAAATHPNRHFIR